MKQKTRNIFWGLLFVLLAVYLVASKLMEIPHISLFTIALTVFFVYGLIEGIRHGSFFEAIMSLAFLGCLYDKELGITAITPWTLLIAALLLSIGLEKIFKSVFKKKYKYEEYVKDVHVYTDKEHARVKEESFVQGNYSIDNAFGTSTKYFNNEEIYSVMVDNAFGAINLYFQKAILPNGICEVRVDNAFGAVNLYIPSDWVVRSTPSTALGAVTNQHINPDDPDAPVIEIKASSSFGNIRIL
jgi:predicted membrane protein